MLYRRGQSEARARDYAADYERRHAGSTVELRDVDNPSGQQTAELYDVVNYPAVLALADDGSLLQLWQDEQLPLMKELDFYLHA